MFETIRVNRATAESTEQLGTKRKYWWRDQNDRRMLFKAEERNTGEDWSEKLACELAKLLGLPHVHYDLAEEVQTGTPGVVCENCASAPWSLVMGNELLLARDPTYPAEGRKYKVRVYTVEAVTEVLAALRPPPSKWSAFLPQELMTATDVFLGYVMLDAWIANQDRHHENWAALERDGKRYLGPTFDHAASMARNITDDERADRLGSTVTNRQIEAFVRKAKSAFYIPTQSKAVSTLEAWQLFSHYSPTAAATWLEQLSRICNDDVIEVMDRIPTERMSPICKEFTRTLLNANQQRLLDETN